MGIGAPAAWVNSEAAVDDAKRGMAAKQAQAEQLAAMEQASTTVKNIGQSGMVDQQPAIV
jgi:hypothetical protein